MHLYRCAFVRAVRTGMVNGWFLTHCRPGESQDPLPQGEVATESQQPRVFVTTPDGGNGSWLSPGRHWGGIVPVRKSRLAALVLDHVPDPRRDVRAAQPRNGADAGGRGDVDLGQVAVDHVDADEQQPAL